MFWPTIAALLYGAIVGGFIGYAVGFRAGFDRSVELCKKYHGQK